VPAKTPLQIARGRVNQTAPAPRRVRPGGELSPEDAAKAEAERLAGGETPPSPDGPNVDGVTKRDIVLLEGLFGVAYASSLTPAQVIAEAEWHRREAAGFPEDPPSEALYREHYATAHPGMPVPAYPARGAPRTGRLSADSVRRLGLVPLGSSVGPSEQAYFEPAVVTEGEVVKARDGSWHRVVWIDGSLVARSESEPGPSDAPAPSPSASPSATAAPGALVTAAEADARVAAERRSSVRRGVMYGAIGGLLAGVALTCAVVVLSRKPKAEDPPEASNRRRLSAGQRSPSNE